MQIHGPIPMVVTRAMEHDMGVLSSLRMETTLSLEGLVLFGPLLCLRPPPVTASEGSCSWPMPTYRERSMSTQPV